MDNATKIKLKNFAWDCTVGAGIDESDDTKGFRAEAVKDVTEMLKRPMTREEEKFWWDEWDYNMQCIANPLYTICTQIIVDRDRVVTKVRSTLGRALLNGNSFVHSVTGHGPRFTSLGTSSVSRCQGCVASRTGDILIGIMTMPHYSPPKKKVEPESPGGKPFGDTPSATCHVVMRKDSHLGWAPVAVFGTGEPALQDAVKFMESMQSKRPDLELRIEDRIPLITRLQCNILPENGKVRSCRKSTLSVRRCAWLMRSATWTE